MGNIFEFLRNSFAQNLFILLPAHCLINLFITGLIFFRENPNVLLNSNLLWHTGSILLLLWNIGSCATTQYQALELGVRGLDPVAFHRLSCV
jgi:hypothetical protein